MAVGLPDPPAPTADPRPATAGEIFRGFPIALDPRKMLVAAAGVLAMSVGWYVLSLLFTYPAPDPKAEEYQASRVKADYGDRKKPDGTDYTGAEYELEAGRRLAQDQASWQVRNDLAGEGGRLRTLPWREYRGPNPFLLVTDLAAGSSFGVQEAAGKFLSGTVPVLIEPFVKLLLPVVKILDPAATFVTRIYLVLCLLWAVAVWAFAGGVITRIAAVQLGEKDRVTLPEAINYVARRYKDYVLSPLVPLGLIGVIIVAMAVYGLVALVPVVGDIVLYGLGFPLVMIGGVVMAILLVGLAGYSLMYPTVSVEGSDTFDALSRSYNYVFQAPLSFLWYNLVSLLYGSLAVLFVVFMASLMVYLGKFAVSQAPLSEYSGRKPDFLFVHAPETFGWKQLLLAGSPVAVTEVPTTAAGRTDAPLATTADTAAGRARYAYPDAAPAVAKAYRDDMRIHNHVGAWMVSAWLVFTLLLVIGFSYSYFWSAATIIYLLMRRKVDETDFDEVYVEEPLPEPTVPPATGVGSVTTPTTPAAPAGGVTLPTVPATPPAAAYPPPPPAYTPPAYVPPPPLPLSPPPAAVVQPTIAVPPAVPAVTTPDSVAVVTNSRPDIDEPDLPPPPADVKPAGDYKPADEFKKDTDSL